MDKFNYTKIKKVEAELAAHKLDYASLEGVNDGVINPEKTTFFKSGKNLFNSNNVSIDTSVRSETGELAALAGYFVTDYIKVEPNTTYTRSHEHSLAYYDINKVFISGVSSALDIFTFTTPINCYYIRAAAKIGALSTFQIEKGSAKTLYEPYKQYLPQDIIERAVILPSDIANEAVTPEKTTFIKLGKNMFNKATITTGYLVSSTTGELVALAGYFTSDFIPVLPNTTYTRSYGYTLAYYDIDKVFISGISGSDNIRTFTTPPNTAFIRTSCANIGLNSLQVELGSESTQYEDYHKWIDMEFIPNNVKDPKFVAEFATSKQLPNISDSIDLNLSLIAIKTIQKGNTPPDTVGYLYLNESSQKLYYSKAIFNNPEYLCDWDSSLSDGSSCQNYQATITKDGDIIFLKNWTRGNPIIYPANDYNNPYVVDFGELLKPCCWLNNTGIDHSPTNDYFVFGEYTTHKLADEQNNDPRNIWKVTKPYNNPSNWQIKHSFKHVYFTSPESDEPGNEIGHIHTIIRDFYSGAWYCSTGDIDRHCRVWESLDEGETWYEVASVGQKWRALGMIFTKDSAYWGTDAGGTEHALYKVDRNPITGVLDFTNLTLITSLFLSPEQTQRTYSNHLLREPHGLLFLDRAEPRPDNKLDLFFWSFKYERLFTVGTYDRVENGDILEVEGRHGFGNQVATIYQPTLEDGIITGGGSVVRPMTLDLLNNRVDNFLGNIKIKIREI
jgi:hypothetical protein